MHYHRDLSIYYRFSGLTAQDLSPVTTRLRDVQQDLLNLFYEDTILLGHSLESDLLSLKVCMAWFISNQSLLKFVNNIQSNSVHPNTLIEHTMQY